MTKLQWGSSSARIYEHGADRGVFYPDTGPGIPWNGLVAVKDDPSVEDKFMHVDGAQYTTQKTRASFAAVLQAYTSPIEFDEYDGSSGQQRRKPFGLSYRTRIGNGFSSDHGHKIHLVYNALAMPTTMDSSTLNRDGLEATPFSWGISTKPIHIPGAKPAAHLIIDTSIAYPEAIQSIENVLYGSDETDARLPMPEELLDLFEQHAILVIVDHGNGTWSAIGPDEAINMLDANTFAITWPSAIPIDDISYEISSL